MEEDLKIIEEMLRLNKNRIEPQIKNAIENLINKNKELEKENKQLKKYWGNKIAEYHKIIELMADSLSDCAYYMDEAMEYCEVKKKECDCFQNKTECKKCLLDYFRKKAKGE